MGFHSMEYLEILRQAGIPDAQAEAQIEVLRRIMELEALKKEVASKQDLETLRKEITSKQDLEALKKEIASKQDLETLKKEITSKQDLGSMENRILIKFGALIFFFSFIGILIMVGFLKSGIL